MTIPAGFGAPLVPHRARPTVQCAACGSRFDADGATTGDRVRCPLCREVVEVAQLVAEKRRYRMRTEAVPPPPPRVRRSQLRGQMLVFAATVACSLVWRWRHPIWNYVYELGRELAGRPPR